MKISKTLPQFENSPALFLVSGEYEAHFYVAKDGIIEEKKSIKHSPRENAKEKQGFITASHGPSGIGAVSHHGAYVEDLKRKFIKEVHQAIDDLVIDEKIKNIYFFAPRYVDQRLFKEIPHYEQVKIKMEFHGEYIHENPMKIIRLFQEELEKGRPKIIYTKEEQKILSKPKT